MAHVQIRSMTRQRALELHTNLHISYISDSQLERPTRQSNSREATQEADAMHRALFPEYENYENHHMYMQRSGNAQLPSPVIGEDLLAGLDNLTLIKKTMYNSPTN